MLSLFLALFLAAPFPSASKTAWMRPESFHLLIGMSRADTMKKLAEAGWKTKPLKNPSHLVIEYTNADSITLEFHKERLQAVRFEHFAFLQDARSAFAEEVGYLHDTFGAPKSMKIKSVVLYDHILPNVMVVLSDDPKSENGQKGLGLLVVRYYDPLS